jgi:ribonuclease HI
MKKLEIYTDGGARGNPGPAAIGVVIWSGNNLIGTYSKYIGEATNNQAEYQALLYGLERARQLKAEAIDFYLDSELVVNQLNMKFKIKNHDLGPWFIKIWNLRQSFKKVTFNYIPREKNREADKLLNRELDKIRP